MAARQRKATPAASFVENFRGSAGAGEIFGISDLANEFRTTLRAIRFYESKGLLAPQRVNGARVYTRRDRARLVLILRARAIGASLEEIRHYLDLYGRSGEGRSKQLNFVVEKTDDAIRRLRERRAKIDETLAELEFINRSSRNLLAERRRQVM
ncbi:MAG: MerR family DNA-binding transcriptional regulator [Myxococcota bacterium]